METNDVFIGLLTDVAINLPSQNEGCVYILGSRREFARVANSLMRTFRIMDKAAMYYSYNMNFVEVEESQLAELGYNIVCPIKNPISNVIEYVVGSCEVVLMPTVITSVINEAETHLKAWAKETIVLLAQDNVDYFRLAIDQAIDKLYPEPVKPLEKRRLQTSSGDLFDDTSLCCCLPSASQFARISGSSEEKPRRNQEPTKKGRKSTLTGISGKLSSHNNRDREQIIEYINRLNVNELRTILSNVLLECPESLKSIKDKLDDLSSKYVLQIKDSDMNGSARYYIVLTHGNETHNIRFTNKPSLCIFVLFVLDRVKNGDKDQHINLQTRKDEFCELYKELYNVDNPERVEEIYDEIFYRNNGERLRSGRKSQYFSDINNAFKKELGETDSIPFQVGDIQPLKQLPSKIEIAENLQRFVSARKS